jgi:uncharacterized membrane protein
MHPKTFIDGLDDDKIIAAIARAERETTGEIRICVSHVHHDDVLAGAKHRFFKLKMNRAPDRNGVLIYFSPRAQQFAVFGDAGAHEKCGDEFWKNIVAQITPRLKKGELTEAVVEAIESIGKMLARHFPRKPGGTQNQTESIVRE